MPQYSPTNRTLDPHKRTRRFADSWRPTATGVAIDQVVIDAINFLLSKSDWSADITTNSDFNLYPNADDTGRLVIGTNTASADILFWNGGDTDYILLDRGANQLQFVSVPITSNAAIETTAAVNAATANITGLTTTNSLVVNTTANTATANIIGLTTTNSLVVNTTANAATANITGNVIANNVIANTNVNCVNLYISSTGNLADGTNVIVGNSSGTKIGTNTAQKLGFWNTSPVVQPAAAGQAAVTNNTSGTYDAVLNTCGNTAGSDQSGIINNNFTDVWTLLDSVRTCLVSSGLMKGSA